MKKIANILWLFFLAYVLICGEREICFAQNYTNKISPGCHQHNEQSYQQAWQRKYGGILEYKNDDCTRVDCLTSTHAIEFDFANKWAEAVGQALYYQYKTGKRAKVVLILEHPQSQMVYFNRVKALSRIHNFDVEYITPEILNLNCKNQCQNPKCKCHKK